MLKKSKDSVEQIVRRLIPTDKDLKPIPLSLEQDMAANPQINVLVQANAGTGKTSVLVQRLLRILFNSPECTTTGILCLTYTNAGAGVMRNRILQWLRYWVRVSDERLAELLAPIVTHSPVTPDDIVHARQIFFKYIDNPEMLKIKTFHSFCEEILHRFPLEAGITPGWTLITDAGQSVLLQTAFDRMLNTNSEATRIFEAFEKIATITSEYKFDEILQTLSKMYKRFLMVDDVVKYREQFIDTTRKFLKLDCVPQMEISEEDLRLILQSAISEQNAKKKPVGYLTDIINIVPQYIDKTVDFQKYKTLYLKSGDGQPDTRYFKDKPILMAEAERVCAVDQYLINTQIFDNTLAMFDLIAEFARVYQHLKKEQNILDFDDLILLTHKLFSDSAIMGWVLSQLDVSLSHILIDEAQDTSPEQWEVLILLLQDFLVDGDVSEMPRSLFVVGDIKQSIYGFQGADAMAFMNACKTISAQLENDQRTIQQIALDTNYRSCVPVLASVDNFFNDETVVAISNFQNMPHKCGRPDMQGCVEVHPLSSKKGSEETYEDYVAKLADKIASLVDGGVLPSEIMVLVRNRNRLVGDLTAALKRRSISVAGLDRIMLPEYSAVRDVLNLIRWCLNTADDYSLCCVLKSPFFCLTEANIYSFCEQRNAINSTIHSQKSAQPYVTLFDVIQRHNPELYTRLAEIQQLAQVAGPYTFVSDILNTDNVRENFIGALGVQVIEPLEEFISICLSYERTQTGTLYHFLKWFVVSSSEIKRDMQAATGVRIMTVHGSKGLEARCVFLVDTVRQSKGEKIFPITVDNQSAWLWLPAETLSVDCRALEKEFSAKQLEESYRLLYVGMTRAECELYIYGQTDKTPPLTSWHSQLWRVFSGLYPLYSDTNYIRITNDDFN